jgi:hypothetical protein
MSKKLIEIDGVLFDIEFNNDEIYIQVCHTDDKESECFSITLDKNTLKEKK